MARLENTVSSRVMEETGEGVARQGVLLILAGPTGAGKTEVLKGLMRQDPTMKRVISTTTRGPRVEINEQDGVDYHFSDLETFQADRAEGAFLETEKYFENWYGTKKQDVEPVLTGTDVAWIVNMAKARKIEETYREMFDLVTAESLSERTLLILIGTPSMLSLYRRYQQRGKKGSDFDTFKGRVKEDLAVWNEHKEDFFHVVINRDDELHQTIQTVAGLIEQKREELTAAKL